MRISTHKREILFLPKKDQNVKVSDESDVFFCNDFNSFIIKLWPVIASCKFFLQIFSVTSCHDC